MWATRTGEYARRRAPSASVPPATVLPVRLVVYDDIGCRGGLVARPTLRHVFGVTTRRRPDTTGLSQDRPLTTFILVRG